MNLKKIQKILSITKGIDGWRIFQRNVQRKNIYVVKNFEVEDILSGNRTDASIKVYSYFGDEIGDSEFPVVTDDESVLQKQLSDAIFICSLSKKRKYSLPEKHVFTVYPKLRDETITKITNEQLLALVQQFKMELEKYDHVMLNSMELHTSCAQFTVINNKGINITMEKTQLFVEFIITAFLEENEQRKEQEFVSSVSFARMSDLNIEAFVRERVTLVKDVSQAQQSTNFKGEVLLCGDAPHEFFVPHLQLSPLLMHCSAKLKYMDLSTYKQGKAIGAFKADKITMKTNPFVDYNPASSLFDEDGVVSKPVTLIEEGVFKQYFASQQYADYLSIPATGSLGVFEVKPGSKSTSDLAVGDHAEIVSFASFVPDAISGAFSAEIRLGYYVKQGKRIPFRGGMFTGNVFDLIKNCSLSEEIITTDGYSGPKTVCFHKGVIAGLKK